MKLGKKIRDKGSILMSLTMFLSAFAGLGSPTFAATIQYDTALNDGIGFYDANKCGKDVAEHNIFNWRGACHVNDGQDVGLDLTGGYHDCGDHVKFGITQVYAASVLGWGFYDYRKAFDQTGATRKTLETLKHFTDYLLKCHPNANTFYYQVGDGYQDHGYWGSPENQQGNRQTIYKVDSSNPGSDVAGGASAALAIMYLNYKAIDSSYAENCLNAAKSLYNLAKVNYGLSQGQSFYYTSSYKDDLAWAATWLYQITGEASYLSEAEAFVKNDKGNCNEDNWTMCWDDMYSPTILRLYELTHKEVYKEAALQHRNYWDYSVNTTSGGLKFLTGWGSLRYSAAESALAMKYYQLTGDEKAKAFATSQINYILGDNPNNMSYIIGYGDQYPKSPHHRAASGTNYVSSQPAKYLLKGALVGGPTNGDSYNDDATDYTASEVGLDYNAGFVTAVAALIAADGSGSSVVIPSPSVVPSVSPSPSVAPSLSTSPSVVPSVSPSPSVVPSVSPSPSVVPSVSPSPSVAPSMSPSPSVVPSVTPSAAPSTPETTQAVKVAVTTQGSSSINQVYTISANETVDLSKVSIRFYFEKSDSKPMNFWCDNAGLQLSVTPWYVNYTSGIKANFGKEGNKNYIEIKLNQAFNLQPGVGSLTIQTRSANADWSNISGFKDCGYQVFISK